MIFEMMHQPVGNADRLMHQRNKMRQNEEGNNDEKAEGE